MDDLYNRVLDLGKARGYSNMTAICKAAGVPRTVMSELKMGRSAGLSLATARKFAALLQVSTDYLLGSGQGGDPDEGDELDEYLQAVADNPKLRVLFMKGKSASPEKLDAILALLGGDDET